MEEILARIEVNMQTKDDAKNQMKELKESITKITKEFNDKIDKFQKENDKKYSECQSALKELRQQFEQLKKRVTWEKESKRPCNSATRSSSQGGAGARVLKDEIREKLERRVTVGGFLGNSSKVVRETAVKEFVAKLGTMENYGKYEVFAKGATGPEAVIQMESRERASQFIKDNIEAIKTFKIQGNAGESRSTFFSLHLDENQWKIYHATRLLTSKIIDSQKLDPMTIKAVKHRGIVSINDFSIIKIKVGMDDAIEYKYVKQNLKDLGGEGVESKLKELVDEFAVSFK